MRNPLTILRIIKSFYVLARDPNRLDQVFALADSGANQALMEEVSTFLERDPRLAAALVEQPRLGRVDLAELSRLPAGTLGHEFAAHMLRNGLDPAAIPVPDAPNDVWYVRTHLRETHDIWHVVTGMGTDVAGELALQAFYLAQMPSRLSSALMAMGLIHISAVRPEAREVVMNAIVHGWLVGQRSRPLFGVAWAKLWSTPLTEVRAQLGVDVKPETAFVPPLMPYTFETTRATA